ncbi:MAG: DUF4159 domain-containing protein [Bacteroidota bacterium]
MLILLALLITPIPEITQAQNQDQLKVARIKYRGGGDWYNDPSSLTNLLEYASQQLPLSISSTYDDVDLGDPALQQYPFAFLTGHGTIKANSTEIKNLRAYLTNGGFLFVDDDYGLDKYIRQLLRQTFPNEELVELPFDHPVYHQRFEFPDGLPKIHEHDGKPPQGFAILIEGRMVVFYAYESNLGDGWANPRVHNDPPEVREKALQMGTNILLYALTQP